MAVFTGKIEIGQRVVCSLPYCGTGIVFAKHGTEKPETVSSVNGVMVSGGGAYYDVVWLQGAFSRMCPEALVRGSVQWRVLDSVATPEEVEKAVQYATEVEAEKQRAAEKAANDFYAKVEELRNDPQYKGLTQGDESSGTLAGKNMRVLLKQAFKGVKFSVRKNYWGSVTVSWTDGPTEKQVEAITNRFKDGHFDGNQDLYVYESTPWTKVFGSVKYVRLDRHLSDVMIEKAIESAWAMWGHCLNGQCPSVEDFKKGACFDIQIGASNLQSEIHRCAAAMAMGC